MKIIVGLGNPGDKYKKTRHNVGFIILNKIAEEKNLGWRLDKKFNSLIIKDDDTFYLKPQTFMNNSGQAVQAIMSYYNLLPKKFGIIKKLDCDLSDTLTVIHDDLDIDFGKIKETINSRSAGHNGVQSIINHLKTKKFRRIRVGIKSELRDRIPAQKFVLSNFSKDEINKLKNLNIEL